MSTMDYNQLVDIMLSESDEVLKDLLLVESEQDQVVAALDGDTTMMNYLLLLEEYLDAMDVYLFDGWEDAAIVAPPMIEKFWVTYLLRVCSKTDLTGARRIKDAMKQGDVRVKKFNGGYLVKLLVLRRDLDKLETDSTTKIEQMARDDMDVVR